MGNRFAVFLAGEVGLTVLDLFLDTPDALYLAVLDPADLHGQNKFLIEKLERYHNVLVIENQRLIEPKMVQEIRDMHLDLGILAAWNFKISEPILSITKRGFLNGHPSYLPYCRGKHPHFWCIQEGVPCGATIHFINEKLDTGPIVFQENISYDWTDNGETLYYKSWNMVRKLFTMHKDEILALELPSRPAKEGIGNYHYAAELGLVTQIDLDKSYTARNLLNLLRGRTFPPYPSAYFTEEGATFEVRVSITKKEKNEPNVT